MSRRDPEAGNTMVLALVVMSALATLAGTTVVSVQGGQQQATSDRFYDLALYAAESGGAVAMDCLRAHVDPVTNWTAYVSPNNLTVQTPACAGNGVPPGSSGNLMSNDQHAWYQIEVLNNRSDTGFASGTDDDRRLVIRSTGHGPNDSIAVVELEIYAELATTPFTLVSWRVVL